MLPARPKNPEHPLVGGAAYTLYEVAPGTLLTWIWITCTSPTVTVWQYDGALSRVYETPLYVSLPTVAATMAHMTSCGSGEGPAMARPCNAPSDMASGV